ILSHTRCSFFFFFNDTATTEIYTLSLHDALPICSRLRCGRAESGGAAVDSDLRCSCVIWRQLRAGMDVEPAPWPAHPQQRIPDARNRTQPGMDHRCRGPGDRVHRGTGTRREVSFAPVSPGT